MKKILMICNYFAPDNTIAAVRITKIAKYLKRYDYEITVIAEKKFEYIKDEILEKDIEGTHVIRIENSNSIKKVISLYKALIGNVKRKRYDNLENRIRINRKTRRYEFYPFQTAYPLIGSLDYLVDMLRQYDLFKMSKVYLCDFNDIDYIFTSYGDLLGIFAGAYLHKRHKNIPWIVDIRDAICNYKFTPKYVRWIAMLLERYVGKHADCITAVSKGICRRIPKKYWTKVHCVTNGYDKEDREKLSTSTAKHSKMRFTYTGSMYGGLQDLSPLFDNIRKLINMNLMDLGKLEICFAGKETSFRVFESQARKYELDGICKYYGMITRRESLELQGDSDILLVASFDYQTNECGIITGKVLEYMSANKTVIAIINGDVKHSELGKIIREANLGFAYEEAHCHEDSELLRQYLLDKYRQFMDKGKIDYVPNVAFLKYFDYKYLGIKIAKIIAKI